MILLSGGLGSNEAEACDSVRGSWRLNPQCEKGDAHDFAADLLESSRPEMRERGDARSIENTLAKLRKGLQEEPGLLRDHADVSAEAPELNVPQDEGGIQISFSVLVVALDEPFDWVVEVRAARVR